MRVIDLTRPFSPEVAGFEQSVAKTMDPDGWNASTLSIYSHAGTHMDAPRHFDVSPDGIDAIPPAKLISKAWVVNATNVGPSGLIPAASVVEQLPSFHPGDSLLIRTGWEHQFGTPAFRDALPRISEELARWCVANQVNMLGVEPPSVADVNNMEEVTLIHQILLGSVIIVEGLVNLGTISQPYVKLMAFPLSIQGGDGAPARVLAIEEEDYERV